MMGVVLAVITDWDLADNVVGRARHIAAALGAGLSVYRPVSDQLEEMNRYVGFDNYQSIRDELIAHNKHQVEKLLDTVDADYVVDWQPHAYRGISTQAENCGAELIIMAMSPHSVLGDLLHKPDDWHLLREAVCPVLFLSRSEHPFRSVVAAIDCLNDSEESQILAARILDEAKSMAEAMKLPLRVMSVVPDPAFLYADLSASSLMIDYRDQAKTAVKESLDQLLLRLGISPVETIVETGKVETLLEEAVADAGLLVLGTIANKGLKGLVVGNTAERILSHVAGDLLVVN